MTYEELKAMVIRLQAEGVLPRGLTEEQRIDWAYGNAVLSNPKVTREDARKAVLRKRNANPACDNPICDGCCKACPL